MPVEERVWTRETLDLGLVEGLLQLVAGEDAGEVEERAGGGGGGDSVVRGRLVRWENRSVKEESWPLGAGPGRGDLDAAVRGPDALRGRRSPRPRQVGRVGAYSTHNEAHLAHDPDRDRRAATELAPLGTKFARTLDKRPATI